MKSIGLALSLLALGSLSGCATLLHPERSLTPKAERGSIDGVMLAGDIVVSIPMLPVVLLLNALSSPFGQTAVEEDPGILAWAVWVDHRHGTLYRRTAASPGIEKAR